MADNFLINADSTGVTTPDSAGLTITGDMDLRMEFQMPIYPASNATPLLNQSDNSANGYYAWRWVYHTGGVFRLYLSTDGTTFLTNAASAVDPVAAGTRHWARVTRQQSSGDIKFWYATDATGSSWTQIGTTQAGTTSALYDSTGVIGICRDRQGGDVFCGLVYQVEIRASIAGAIIASADFRAKSAGAASFNDAQGNTWTYGAKCGVLVAQSGGGGNPQLVNGGLVKSA